MSLQTDAQNKLRATRLFQLAQQLRTFEGEIRQADIQIRNICQRISGKMLSMKNHFAKAGQEDAELKNDPEFKLLVNWLENFSAPYKISYNLQGQTCKIVLQVLIKIAGDLEGVGYIEVIELGPDLRSLSVTFPLAKTKQDLQYNTRLALGFRLRLCLNSLKCQESLKALRKIQLEMNTSSRLLEKKNTKFMKEILTGVALDNRINQIISNLVPVTQQMAANILIQRDLKAQYIDFEVEDPNVVKIIASKPQMIKSRELLKHEMDQLIRIQNEKQIALQNRTTIQAVGEKSQVSETVLAFWEAYQ